MPYPMSPEQIAAGDALAPRMERQWGWFLVGGILSVLFGFVLVSQPTISLVALALVASGFFIAIGFFQLAASFSMARHRALYIAAGSLWIVAGIIGISWPGITLYVITILIGWAFLLFGITDLVHSLHNRHLTHWWYNLIRGLASLVIAFIALVDPGGTLEVLVLLLGIYAVFFGVIEIVGSFSARHATRHWEQLKSQLQ
jgi:uncharacterized membrane protein HdeD (DUF308 family)